MISYQHSRNERQWRASTGLTQKQFELLTAYVEETYLFVNERSINQIDNNLAMERILHTYADCLFFVLFQLKNALTYDSLGLLIQTDASNGQRIFEKYLHLLELTLERKHIMPKRNFTTVAEFEAYLKNDTDIILDVSEQPIQRPANGQAQKAAYSGKKKRHTCKELIMSNKKRKILYISPFYVGHESDYSLLKAEFPSHHKWFAKCRVRLDLGFQGFRDLYESESVQIPHKRKRVKKGESNELSDEQKAYNRSVSSERIVVEHSIGGMKRYRILGHVNRLKVTRLTNSLLGVCAALWNFTIA